MRPPDEPFDREAFLKQLKDLKLTEAKVRQYLGKIAWRRAQKLAMRGDFDEKYPEDPITMFLVMGKQFFDKDILIARKRELVGFKPFGISKNGDARLFHKRIPGRRYLIGADPATGRTVFTEDTDNSAAVVIDMETGEEMAAYRARVTPVDFAWDLDELGRYYNDAPIAVERTGDGGTVILVLGGDCKYPAIVKFKEWHRKNKKMIEVEGFPTNLRTRPIALNFAAAQMKEHPETIWDEQYINEALLFVRDERGIPAGANGSHDDTVSARWIAFGARAHLLGYWTPGDGRREKYGDLTAAA